MGPATPPQHAPEQRRLPWLRRTPLVEQGQASGLARGRDALHVGVAAPVRIALGRDQRMARHGV